MRRLAPVVAMMILAGCGGPKVPLEIVGKSVPIGVSFGPNGALPPVQVRPTPGGFVVVPPTIPPEELPPIVAPPPPPPPRPCPDPHPFSFPKKAATDAIYEAPAAAQYRFRFSGERVAGDERVTVAPLGMRTVGNTDPDPTGGFRYDVSEVAGAEVRVSSYRVTSNALELTGEQVIAQGRQTRFAPATPITLLPLPPRQADVLGRTATTWSSAATDPATQTTKVLEGKLVGTGKARVNACGEVVDTWLAELSVRTVSPSEDTTATWRINVATQYGGLLVQEVLNVTGAKNGAAYKESRKATISELPKERAT